MVHEFRVTGVNFVILRPDGMALLQKRDDKPGIRHPGKWCFPGGAVEAGEDVLIAAVREVKEETGLEISPEKMKFLLDFSDQPDSRQVGRFFFCEVDNNAEVISSEGKMHWKAFEDIELLDFAPNHKALVPNLKRAIEAYGQSQTDCTF